MPLCICINNDFPGHVLLYVSQPNHAHTSLQAPGSGQPTSKHIKLYNNILCYITFTYCLYYYTIPNMIMHTQACKLLGVDNPHQTILNYIIIYYVTLHLHIVCITIRFPT